MHSCGAILYTYMPNGKIGIILGLEYGHWFPFKGCQKEGETFKETAIREIYEETCGLIKLIDINLDQEFKTKHKTYHIGLEYVPRKLLDNFSLYRSLETRPDYMEKDAIHIFPLDDIWQNKKIHYITKKSIGFYKSQLLSKQNKTYLNTSRTHHTMKIVAQAYAKKLLPTYSKYNSNTCPNNKPISYLVRQLYTPFRHSIFPRNDHMIAVASGS